MTLTYHSHRLYFVANFQQLNLCFDRFEFGGFFDAFSARGGISAVALGPIYCAAISAAAADKISDDRRGREGKNFVFECYSYRSLFMDPAAFATFQQQPPQGSGLFRPPPQYNGGPPHDRRPPPSLHRPPTNGSGNIPPQVRNHGLEMSGLRNHIPVVGLQAGHVHEQRLGVWIGFPGLDSSDGGRPQQPRPRPEHVEEAEHVWNQGVHAATSDGLVPSQIFRRR